MACGAGYALALLALLGGALAKAPAGLLIAAAAMAGLVNPPLSPGMRSLWSAHAGARFTPAAFALDAAVFDLAYITGPVLASALATGIAPAAALALMLALTGVAVPVVGRQARRPEHGAGAALARTPVGRAAPAAGDGGAGQRGNQRDRGRADRLRPASPRAVGLRPAAGRGIDRQHPGQPAARRPRSRGRLRPQDRRRHRRLGRLLAGYAGGLALLTVAGLYAPLLAVAAPLAGLCLGPTLATLFSEAASAAPRGGGIQTQAWINSTMNGGAAAGAAAAGAVLAGFGPAVPSSPLLSPLPSPSPPRPAPPSPGMHDNQGTQRASFGRKKGQRRGGAGPRLRRQAHREVRR